MRLTAEVASASGTTSSRAAVHLFHVRVLKASLPLGPTSLTQPRWTYHVLRCCSIDQSDLFCIDRFLIESDVDIGKG
jgi:hypothetical protein